MGEDLGVVHVLSFRLESDPVGVGSEGWGVFDPTSRRMEGRNDPCRRGHGPLVLVSLVLLLLSSLVATVSGLGSQPPPDPKTWTSSVKSPHVHPTRRGWGMEEAHRGSEEEDV